METVRIDILNPKAKKILAELAELKLIKIQPEQEKDYVTLLNRLRKKEKPLSFGEITHEVEQVRDSREKYEGRS